MPLLDVSEVLTDPDIATTFDVRRRAETVGTNGRSATSDTLFRNVVGVVTAIGPSDLERADGYQVTPRRISVVTKFRLRGEVTGFQPDVVVWRGSNYLVKAVDPYPQFGNGFVQAECSSMDKTDPALEPPAPGQFAFNIAAQSGLVGVV